MARFSLIPREEQFFKDFVNLAEQIRSGASTLRRMMAASPIAIDQVTVIKDLEHQCDESTRSIIDRLNRTFVTPLDREDIHALAVGLDDVMDAIDAAAAVTKLYKVTEARFGARRLAEIVADATDLVAQAVAALEKKQGVLELAARISQLEHEADRVHQDAIVALFEDEKGDPITVIKWKEILDFLEAATDRCEDVANRLEGTVVKHG
jgi:predicted phosphate transport protein (TIGR00153 family)